MRAKDSQPGAHDEADDLEALASELGSSAPEDDVDDDVDLDRLAAVARGRGPAGANGALADEATSEKLDLSAKPVTERPAAMGAPPPAAVPAPEKVVAPAAAQPPRASNRLVPALVVLALGLGGLGYALGRSSQPASTAPVAAAPPQQTPAAPSASAVVSAPPPAPTPATPAAPTAPIAEPTAPPPAEATLAAAPFDSAQVRAKPAAAPRPAPQAATAPQSPAAPAPVEPAPVVRVEPSAEKDDAAPAAAKSTVDDLLDQALAGSGQRRAAEVAAQTELPEAPSREEVTQTMAVLLPAIRGCAMGQTGLATAGIVVRADGRVASVELSGAPFADTASGRCMEGVIRRARFARFRQPTFRVRFPFAIQ